MNSFTAFLSSQEINAGEPIRAIKKIAYKDFIVI
jgi:hypothetical protein